MLPLPEHTHVMSGCEIARTGKAGVPGAHLHFEVQQIFEASRVSPAVRDQPALGCLKSEKISAVDVHGNAINRDATFCLPVDPYGWAPTTANCPIPFQCTDPYQSLTGVTVQKLWAQ
jgi:hypothetical protein